MPKSFPRIGFLFVFFMLIAGLISWRLCELQIGRGGYYKAMAKGQQTVLMKSEGKRGKVFVNDAQNLAVLATQKESYLCYSVPKEFESSDENIKKLSDVLGLDENFIREKNSNKDNQFSELKKELTNEEVEAIKLAGLKGVYLKQTLIPYYPLGKLAANILGYIDRENNGQYGVEGFYNDRLRPSEESIAKDKGILGHFDSEDENSLEGASVVLTIDLNIQKKAQELLEEKVKEYDADGGQIVVMDPFTGKILAMANAPTYDPNQYSKFASDMRVFKNGAVQDLYEPGSVFKAFTMAIALDDNKITPDTTFKDTGSKKIDKFTITNYNKRVWGERTMTEILERSINTGVMYAQSLVGNQRFYQYLNDFGFFEKTGVDIFGEAYSSNENLKSLRDVNLATASYGQGVTITPLRLAVGYSALANGGDIVRPYVVEKIIEANGKTIEIKPEIAYKGVIKSESARQVREMLNSVTERGYSQAARVPGYFVGGKTGTAQQPGGSGYTMKTWHTFAGIAPIFDPKFVIIIKLDYPKVSEASVSCAPMFSTLAKYIFDYMRIAPEKEVAPLIKVPVN